MFHFDTEVVIQLVMAGFRIKEVPIPTYYGDEICRVNGVRYAKDVVATTIASRLHRLSIFYNRKFDLAGAGNRHYDLKLGYRSSHSVVLDAVPAGARVLDIGCGPGEFARELAKKGCIVDGADQFPPAESSAFRRFIPWTEPDPLPVEPHGYDDVLLLDIIEHLRDPEGLLEGLRRASARREKTPRMIVTTGNVGFAVVRLQLLFGNFNYGKRGILDLTHTRLFTFASLRRLFEQSGFDVERLEGLPAPFPLAFGMNGMSRALIRLNTLLIRCLPGLFSYQILLIATPRPTVEALLDDSIADSAHKAAVLHRHPADARPGENVEVA